MINQNIQWFFFRYANQHIKNNFNIINEDLWNKNKDKKPVQNIMSSEVSIFLNVKL